MRQKLSFFFIFSLMTASSTAIAGAENWLTYHNDRYGATIDYPDFFKPQRASDKDDGREFKSSDGAGFWVAASYNTLDFNVARYRDFILKNLEAGAVVTHQARGDDWFVISGTKGADIFYERYMLSHKAELTESFGMSYPAALKATYDPIVARMAKSFRPGTGFQSP